MTFRVLVLSLLTTASAAAQRASEPPTAASQDPYTRGEAKAMQSAGVLAYGPFPWTATVRTEDVDKVLGERRIRWIETAHFVLGSTLPAANAPAEPDARKRMNTELARMRKRHGKFPERASKLDPWLRLHLYAHRLEELYAEMAQLVGHDPAAPTHLGQSGKFPVLLLQKKSDAARYLDRFCGFQSQTSQRCEYGTGQRGFVLVAEGDEPYDEATVHAQLRFFAVQTFCDALGDPPYWLALGLAHWFERQVPCILMMATIKDDESVDEQSQNDWGPKIRKRAQHEELLIPFHELATKTDFGYWAHVQAWSRVDFLMEIDRARLGAFLAALQRGGLARQVEQLEAVFGLTPEDFDTKWRAWLRKGK